MGYKEIPERIEIVDSALTKLIETFTSYPAIYNAFHGLDPDNSTDLQIELRAELYSLLIADEKLIAQGKLKIGEEINDDEKKYTH